MEKIQNDSPIWLVWLLRLMAVVAVVCVLITDHWIKPYPGSAFSELMLSPWWKGGQLVVYGFGFWLASYKPYKFWPLLVVAVLEKVAVLIWLVMPDITPTLGPGEWEWISAYYFLWIPPLSAASLIAYHESHRTDRGYTHVQLSVVLKTMITSEGLTLEEHSFREPTVLVLIRHFGCTFCRLTLDRLNELRAEIDGSGKKLVIVYMSDLVYAEKFLKQYNLVGVAHLSDPHCQVYNALKIKRGSYWQVFGPLEGMGFLTKGIAKGYGVGLPGPGEDGFRMPGTALIYQGKVLEVFHPKSASDVLDFGSIFSIPVKKSLRVV